jgi:CubicO group peptidase (beta-lactamase class C family)
MGGLWSCIADLAKWVTWFTDAFPARDGDDAGPLCRASRREMQQVQRSWHTEHTPASGEGDLAVPERIDGGGYGFGLFVRHDTRFAHFVEHSGGLPGYGSNMRWLPGRAIGVIALGNVTYAPMSPTTRRMMEILDDHGLVPGDPRHPAAPLIEAAHRLSVLLSRWTDAEAGDLFADNVAVDEPLDRRARHAAEWAAQHGSLTVVTVDASTPLRGQVLMRHADGTERRFDVEMSPLVPSRLQLYETVTE